MDRRRFVQGTGLAALGVAMEATAQRNGAVPRVGVLTANPKALPFLAFLQGLRELGYVDGKSIQIEVRSADGDFAKLPALAADLVR